VVSLDTVEGAESIETGAPSFFERPSSARNSALADDRKTAPANNARTGTEIRLASGPEI